MKKQYTTPLMVVMNLSTSVMQHAIGGEASMPAHPFTAPTRRTEVF